MPLERAGLTELIGEDMLFPTLPVAEEAYVDVGAGESRNRQPEARANVDGRRVQA